MENLIGWLLIAVAVGVPFLVGWAGFKLYRRHQRLAEEAEQEWFKNVQESAARKREQARKELNKMQTRTKTKPQTSYANSTYTSTTSTASSSSNDNLLSDLATLYVLNSALQHGSASAKVDYDSGTVKTDNSSSSSWGLDDDNSRKSVESTFSSSNSSSSWDSSSSDSGPSSDW